MDFDALVNLKRVFMSSIINETDIMLLKSAINNGSININLSISGNLDAIFQSNINNSEFMVYLEEFINCDEYYLNTPIYKLFLTRKCYYPLLYASLKKDALAMPVYENVILELFNIALTSQGDESMEVAIFIRDMLSVKGKVDFTNRSAKEVIVDFIVRNIDAISGSCAMTSIINKDIILKLISYGYVEFDDFYSYAGDDSLLKMLFYSLLDTFDYSYILSVINKKTVSLYTSDVLMSVVSDYQKENFVNMKMIKAILDKLEVLKDLKLEDKKALM